MHTRATPVVLTMNRATALQIAANPDRHVHRPLRFRLAWITLKAERGQTVCQHRLPTLQRAAGMIQ